MNPKSKIAAPSSKNPGVSYRPLAIVIFVGVLVSVLAFITIRDWENNKIILEFKQDSEERIFLLERSIESSNLIVESLQSFYTASKEVERQEFREFVRPLLSQNPFIQALEWIPRVRASERTAYEKTAQLDGFPDFQITEMKAEGEMIRATLRDEHFPVYFIEPFHGNKPALGFDLLSNPRRKEALLQSRDSNQMVATARIILVQEKGKQFGFLVFLPIYHKDAATTSVSDRRKSLKGFVLGVFRIGDLVQKALADLARGGIDIFIYDLSAPDNERFLCFFPSQSHQTLTEEPGAGKDVQKTLFNYTKTLDVAGRQWLILCKPTRSYIASRLTWQPWGASSAILFCTAMLGLYFFVNTRRGFELFKAYQNLQIQIEDRKQAEEALKESEKQYKRLIEGIPDIVYSLSTKRGGIFYSARVEAILGHPVHYLLDNPQVWSNSIHPDDRPTVESAIKNYEEGKEFQIAYRIKDVDGQWHWFSDRSIGRKFSEDEVIIEGLAGDITERIMADQQKIKLEAQLLQSQKMEAIGTLAGGIAHDFNNILSAILGYSELALADLPSETSIRNKLEAIHSSGERARDLVAQILAFSRKDEQLRSPLELHLIINDALKLLRPAIPTTIEIQTQITSKCRIFGDTSKILQIIMNLCTNAYQAMLETGGTLKITLSHEKLGGKVAVLANVPDGFYGKMVISDTGVGIPSENLERIFDPYFTTKEKGKGTGLGLAAVHGICKSHGGSIFVESQIGKGTKFTLYLPLTLDRSDTGKQGVLHLPGGNERILLVDDEQDICEIEKELLEMQGYSVTVKDSAKEALKLFAEQPERFDLVITDMTMPNMTGDRLAEEIRKIRSDVPIILNTGYSEIMTKERAKSLGIKGFLMKPVTMRDLSNTIRKVLDYKEDANKG